MNDRATGVGVGDTDDDSDSDALVAVTGGAIEDAHPAEVINQKDADAVRVRVQQLRDQMSDGYFEMGRLLYRVSRQGLYAQWHAPDGKPYESFKDYVEAEVEFAFRKAKHLMSIWWWFSEEVKDPSLPDRVKQIGWTKAAMLVGVVNSRNADAWIAKARQLSATQLGDEAKKALERSGTSRRPSRPTASNGHAERTEREPAAITEVVEKPAGATSIAVDVSEDLAEDLPLTEPVRGADPLTAEEDEDFRTKWAVKVTGPQRRNIEAACDEASRIAEVPDGKGFLLDLIATHFLSHHAASGRMPADQRANMRDDMLRAVQRALGVDLVVFDAGTSNCIFGDKTLERIAAEAGE